MELLDAQNLQEKVHSHGRRERGFLVGDPPKLELERENGGSKGRVWSFKREPFLKSQFSFYRGCLSGSM